MRKLLLAILVLLSLSGFTQKFTGNYNRVNTDTVYFRHNGEMIYRLWVSDDTLYLNRDKYSLTPTGEGAGTFPGFDTTYNKASRGNHSHAINKIIGLQDSLADSWNKRDTATVLLNRTRASHTFEPKITGGTTNQYYGSDKAWHTISAGSSYLTDDGDHGLHLASGYITYLHHWYCQIV